MKACPSCGTLNEDQATFCVRCREKMEGSTLFCSNCGSKIVSSNKFCRFCGSEVKKIAPVLQQTDTPEKPFVASITPPQKKKRNKKLIITLSIVLPITFIFLAIVIFIAINIFPLTPPVTKPDENRFATDYTLSEDQETLINRWGNPDGFILSIDPESDEQFESWFYYQLGASMIFINDEFIDSESLSLYEPASTPEKYAIYPYEFTSNISRDNLEKVLGKPTSIDNYSDNRFSVLYYGKQLVIIFLDNKFVGASLFSIEPAINNDEINRSFITNAIICKNLDSSMKPIDASEEFKAGTTTIYLSLIVNNFTPDDKITVKWNYIETGEVINAKDFTSPDFLSSNYVGFNINYPDGFPAGKYNSEIFLNGNLLETLEFTIK